MTEPRTFVDLFARAVAFALGVAMLGQLALCGGCFAEEPTRNPAPEPAESGSAESSSGAEDSEESSSEDDGVYMPEMVCMMCTICTSTGPIRCVDDMLCCTDNDPFDSRPADCCPK